MKRHKHTTSVHCAIEIYMKQLLTAASDKLIIPILLYTSKKLELLTAASDKLIIPILLYTSKKLDFEK